jgi:hypothetical protein
VAKVMTFTDAAGNTYQTSYWRVVQINIDVVNRSATIILCAYRDATARRQNKAPVDTRTYFVNDAQFDDLMANSDARKFVSLAYSGVVNVVKDIPDPNKPGQFTNFFAGATDDVDQ